jgi:hypothetical protein
LFGLTAGSAQELRVLGENRARCRGFRDGTSAALDIGVEKKVKSPWLAGCSAWRGGPALAVVLALVGLLYLPWTSCQCAAEASPGHACCGTPTSVVHAGPGCHHTCSASGATATPPVERTQMDVASLEGGRTLDLGGPYWDSSTSTEPVAARAGGHSKPLLILRI